DVCSSDLARWPGRLARPLAGPGHPARALRQPGSASHPHWPVALAAAVTARRVGAHALDGAHRVTYPYRLQRATAGTGGASAGDVRQPRNAAYRPGPGSVEAAPAFPGASTGAGDPGPGRVLEWQLCRGEEGHERALSQALLAG